MADAHELLGQPVLHNGITLSKIHHAAFDNHLIGIDPDGHIHVSERLLMLYDGPLLEQSLKAIAGRMIRLPRSEEHRPDRDRLAARFEQFKRVA
jgi:putative restriction endonuclease